MRRLAALLLLLAACNGETPVPETAATTTQAAASGPVTGGRLVRRLETEATTLNYVLQTTEDERQVLQYLYDPMIDFDQNLEPIPGTVAKWEIEDGGKAYVLHIDPRAKFSDGQPVTAADVIFTLEKILDEESMQFGSWFESLDRAQTKAIDARTVRAVFRQAKVAQLVAFNIGVLPKHVYEKGNFKKNTQVVGNGPYVLKSRQPGKPILLERNANYWREKPHIDSVLFRVISDDNVAWNALKRGDVHVTRVNNDTWIREKEAVQDRVEFHNVWAFSWNGVPWNLKDPLFEDVSVRRALAMAYNRQAIIDGIYHKQARALSSPFLPETWAFNPAVQPTDFDIPAAAALLSAAGWKDSDNNGVLDRDGKPFKFTMLISAGSQTSTDQAQVYQDALRGVGVQMEIATLDAAAFFERILAGNYQAAFLAWTNDPDPDLYSLFHSTQAPPGGLNIGFYSNPEADQLIERGRTAFDRAQRAEIYHQLHEVIANDQPYLFMVQVGMKWAVDRRVKNVRVAKGVGLFLWRPGPFEWWIAKE